LRRERGQLDITNEILGSATARMRAELGLPPLPVAGHAEVPGVRRDVRERRAGQSHVPAVPQPRCARMAVAGQGELWVKLTQYWGPEWGQEKVGQAAPL
jgi:hypothetical protein